MQKDSMVDSQEDTIPDAIEDIDAFLDLLQNLIDLAL